MKKKNEINRKKPLQKKSVPILKINLDQGYDEVPVPKPGVVGMISVPDQL